MDGQNWRGLKWIASYISLYQNVIYKRKTLALPIGPLQLGSCEKNFPINFLYYGLYNLKKARNGKSASKIAKWPSLRPLAFKSKFI